MDEMGEKESGGEERRNGAFPEKGAGGGSPRASKRRAEAISVLALGAASLAAAVFQFYIAAPALGLVGVFFGLGAIKGARAIPRATWAVMAAGVLCSAIGIATTVIMIVCAMLAPINGS